MPVRAREVGIIVGEIPTGQLNAITDVPGVRVGHKTIVRGDGIRTGVTAVIQHEGNLYREKSPAGIAVGNGFGKLAGYTQVNELGNIETPIILTNTLSVGTAVRAAVGYTINHPGNEAVTSVNAVVGEINDGCLNDIRPLAVSEDDVLDAIRTASSGPVAEGSIGAGTGAFALGFTGGMGTSSRLVSVEDGKEYILGVLVLTNFGGLLEVLGIPVGRELASMKSAGAGADGSCIIIVATDAPVSCRNLKRIGMRAIYGLARTGSYMSNGSGDYAIAFSTAYRIPHGSKKPYPIPPLLPNEAMTSFFRAVMDATQEAVYNSLFMGVSMRGFKGREVFALPLDDVLGICRKYKILQ
jgi:D-aminopeptidase